MGILSRSPPRCPFQVGEAFAHRADAGVEGGEALAGVRDLALVNRIGEKREGTLRQLTQGQLGIKWR